MRRAISMILLSLAFLSMGVSYVTSDGDEVGGYMRSCMEESSADEPDSTGGCPTGPPQ